MDRLEPIPSPPGHLVREFCFRAVPVLAFLGAALAVALLWNQRFSGTMLFGEVEPVRSDFLSLEGGTVAELHVHRFDSVTNGQPIATVETLDAGAARTALELVRSEIGTLRVRLALDESRNDQNLADLRVRGLEARVNLATARVSAENARRELERAEQLVAGRILSQSGYDAAKAVHDALQAEVQERSALVDGLQQAIAKLDAAGRRDRDETLEALNRALEVQERQLENSRSVLIRASMDGVVKSLNCRPGDRIPAGYTLGTVTAHHAEQIIGYVRQPLTLDPKPGMAVEIRTRGPRRQVARSNIRSVGIDLETVAAPMRLRGFDNAVERGLAFFVDLPPDLDVHPGELVDLVVRPAAAD